MRRSALTPFSLLARWTRRSVRFLFLVFPARLHWQSYNIIMDAALMPGSAPDSQPRHARCYRRVRRRGLLQPNIDRRRPRGALGPALEEGDHPVAGGERRVPLGSLLLGGKRGDVSLRARGRRLGLSGTRTRALWSSPFSRPSRSAQALQRSFDEMYPHRRHVSERRILVSREMLSRKEGRATTHVAL